MSDALWKTAGVQAEPSDEVQERLAEEAALFLRAGGQITLSEWALLDKSSRAAFAAAGEQVKSQQALQSALAGTVEGLAALTSVVDGGKAMTRALLERLAENASGRLGASDRVTEPPLIP